MIRVYSCLLSIKRMRNKGVGRWRRDRRLLIKTEDGPAGSIRLQTDPSSRCGCGSPSQDIGLKNGVNKEETLGPCWVRLGVGSQFQMSYHYFTLSRVDFTNDVKMSRVIYCYSHESICIAL